MEKSKAKCNDTSSTKTMPLSKAESQKQPVKHGVKVRPFKNSRHCDGCKFTLDWFTFNSITPYLWDCPSWEQLYWYKPVSEWVCPSPEYWYWLGPWCYIPWHPPDMLHPITPIEILAWPDHLNDTDHPGPNTNWSRQSLISALGHPSLFQHSGLVPNSMGIWASTLPVLGVAPCNQLFIRTLTIVSPYSN